jgi:MraZ protein
VPGFSGTYYNTLDPKGRVIIPAPFREILSSTHNNSKLILANEIFDKCLCAYPVDEWNRLIEKVKDKPQTSDAVKYFMRRVIGSAQECEIDKQGRILVSSVLRTNAVLNSEVVLIGLGNRIELWDRKECDSIVDPQKINKEAMMEEFSKLDL